MNANEGAASSARTGISVVVVSWLVNFNQHAVAAFGVNEMT